MTTQPEEPLPSIEPAVANSVETPGVVAGPENKGFLRGIARRAKGLAAQLGQAMKIGDTEQVLQEVAEIDQPDIRAEVGASMETFTTVGQSRFTRDVLTVNTQDERHTEATVQVASRTPPEGVQDRVDLSTVAVPEPLQDIISRAMQQNGVAEDVIARVNVTDTQNFRQTVRVQTVNGLIFEVTIPNAETDVTASQRELQIALSADNQGVYDNRKVHLLAESYYLTEHNLSRDTIAGAAVEYTGNLATALEEHRRTMLEKTGTAEGEDGRDNPHLLDTLGKVTKGEVTSDPSGQRVVMDLPNAHVSLVRASTAGNNYEVYVRSPNGSSSGIEEIQPVKVLDDWVSNSDNSGIDQAKAQSLLSAVESLAGMHVSAEEINTLIGEAVEQQARVMREIQETKGNIPVEKVDVGDELKVDKHERGSVPVRDIQLNPNTRLRVEDQLGVLRGFIDTKTEEGMLRESESFMVAKRSLDLKNTDRGSATDESCVPIYNVATSLLRIGVSPRAAAHVLDQVRTLPYRDNLT